MLDSTDVPTSRVTFGPSEAGDARTFYVKKFPLQIFWDPLYVATDFEFVEIDGVDGNEQSADEGDEVEEGEYSGGEYLEEHLEEDANNNYEQEDEMNSAGVALINLEYAGDDSQEISVDL